MAWRGPENTGVPVGPAVKYPGDTLRLEFRTLNSSGPRLLPGKHESQDCSGLFAAGWAIEGHAPKVCFFLCKMGLQMHVGVSGFHFLHSLRCSHIFSLAVIVNSLQ